jgi:ParB/RepB/Spo0J family partition protein
MAAKPRTKKALAAEAQAVTAPEAPPPFQFAVAPAIAWAESAQVGPLPLVEIDPDPNNVRQMRDRDEARELQDLAENIRQRGVLQRIVVRDHPGWPPLAEDEYGPPRPAGTYMVVFGHRRREAAILAGLKTIPCEIRRYDSEADVLLDQLAENTERSDMQEYDIIAAVASTWAAMERQGVPEPSIVARLAVQLGRTEASVRRLRAMGGLHPDLVAYIRSTGDVPRDGQMKVICQAAHPEQKRAFDAARGSRSYNFWHEVFSALQVERVPMSRARFNPKHYAAKDLGTDLFEEGQFAYDIPQFEGLQKAWMEERVGRLAKSGFADCVILESVQKPYQRAEWKTPAGAEGQSHQRRQVRDGKLPPVDERPKLIYGVGLDRNLEVEEWVFVKKQPKVAEAKTAKEKAEAKAAEVDALEGAGARAIEDTVFTTKGRDFLDRTKRDCLASHVGGSGPYAREPEDLVVLLSVLLRDKVKGSWDRAAPSYREMLDAEGNLQVEGRMGDWIAYARTLAGFAVNRKDDIDRDTVEMLGAWTGAPVQYPTDEEALGHIKGPGLRLIGKAVDLSPEDAKATQKAQRAAIGRKTPHLTPEHLKALAWQMKPPPSFGNRKHLAVPEPIDIEELRGIEMEAMDDEDLLFLLGQPEGEDLPSHEDIRAELTGRGAEIPGYAAEADSAERAIAAQVEDAAGEDGDEDLPDDTVEEDTAAWEQEREEQGDPGEYEYDEMGGID